MFLPFATSAFITTIAVAYSAQSIFGIVFGPIWLPILATIPGFAIGFIVRRILMHKN